MRTSDTFGVADDRGHYDGILGLLQRQEADFSLAYMSLFSIDNRFPPPVKVGPMMTQWQMTIVSSRDPPKLSWELDIGDSIVNCIQPEVLTVCFLALLIAIAFCKTSRTSSHDCVNLLAIILKQSATLRRQTLSMSFMMVPFLLGYYQVHIMYSNMCATDLTVTVESPPIDNYEDLLASDKRPAFDTATRSFKNFFEKASPETVQGKIWSRTSKSNIYSQEKLAQLGQLTHRDHDNIALIGPDYALKIVRAISCGVNADMAKDIYLSRQELQTWSLAMFHATNLSNDHRVVLEAIFTLTTEVGLVAFIERDGPKNAAIDALMVGDHDIHSLYQCMYKVVDKTHPNILIRLRHVEKLFVCDLGLPFMVAVVLLIVECARYKLTVSVQRNPTRNMKLSKAIIRRSVKSNGWIYYEPCYKKVVNVPTSLNRRI